jgi:hypothetical protein
MARRAWRWLFLSVWCLLFLVFLTRRTRLPERRDVSNALFGPRQNQKEAGPTGLGVAGGPAVAADVDALDAHSHAMEVLFLKLQNFNPYTPVSGRGVSPEFRNFHPVLSPELTRVPPPPPPSPAASFLQPTPGKEQTPPEVSLPVGPVPALCLSTVRCWHRPACDRPVLPSESSCQPHLQRQFGGPRSDDDRRPSSLLFEFAAGHVTAIWRCVVGPPHSVFYSLWLVAGPFARRRYHSVDGRCRYVL